MSDEVLTVVTGGAGYINSLYVLHERARDYNVVVLYREVHERTSSSGLAQG